MTDLNERFRQTLSDLRETAHEPLPWAAVTRRSTAGIRPTPAPRRTGLLAVAALLAIAATAGVTYMGGRSQHRISPSTPDSAQPTSDQVEDTASPSPTNSSVAEPTTTLGSPPTAASSTPPGSTANIDAELQAIALDVVAARSQTPSFRATVTSTSSTSAADGTVTNSTTMTNTITLMSDHRFWTEGDTYPWSSYDPSTGIKLVADLQPDGTTSYQRITNVPDYLLGVDVIGYDPLQRPINGSIPDGTISIDNVLHLERPAWSITTTYAAPVESGLTGTNTTTIITDKATGVVLAQRSVFEDKGTTTRQDAEMTTFEAGADLPAAWPGAVPAETVSSHSDYQTADGPLTPEQAVAEFAAPIYLPEQLPADTRIWYLAGSGSGYTNVQLVITIPSGLTERTISMRKGIVTDASKLMLGEIVVDGLICFGDPATNTCTQQGGLGLPPLSAGALAGKHYTISTSIDVDDGPYRITVEGLDPDDTLQLANSLIAKLQ